MALVGFVLMANLPSCCIFNGGRHRFVKLRRFPPSRHTDHRQRFGSVQMFAFLYCSSFLGSLMTYGQCLQCPGNSNLIFRFSLGRRRFVVEEIGRGVDLKCCVSPLF